MNKFTLISDVDKKIFEKKIHPVINANEEKKICAVKARRFKYSIIQKVKMESYCQNLPDFFVTSCRSSYY